MQYRNNLHDKTGSCIYMVNPHAIDPPFSYLDRVKLIVVSVLYVKNVGGVPLPAVYMGIGET